MGSTFADDGKSDADVTHTVQLAGRRIGRECLVVI